MTKIKYDLAMIQTISIFEKVTGAKLKDCIDDDHQGRLIFIVSPGQLWKALGKGSANIKKLETKFNRKIKIVEFNPELKRFIVNLVYPLKIKDVDEESSVITLHGQDTNTNGLLIGRNAQNLRNLEKNVRRFFEVEEIKVV